MGCTLKELNHESNSFPLRLETIMDAGYRDILKILRTHGIVKQRDQGSYSKLVDGPGCQTKDDDSMNKWSVSNSFKWNIRSFAK